MCTSSPLPLTHSAFVFLQLKLCRTAARRKHPSSSRFRESKATAFRRLGAAVTSARLCKAQTFTPSIHQEKVPVVAENETAGNVFALLLILCFSSVSPALWQRMETNCASPIPVKRSGWRNTLMLWRREKRSTLRSRYMINLNSSISV